MKSTNKFVVGGDKDSDTIERRVTLNDSDTGVDVRVNGDLILSFENGYDYIVKYSAESHSGLKNGVDGNVCMDC